MTINFALFLSDINSSDIKVVARELLPGDMAGQSGMELQQSGQNTAVKGALGCM